MHSGGLRRCVGLLAFVACNHAPAPFVENVLVDEQAVEDQQARENAIVAIEGDRGRPSRPLSTDEFESVMSYYCGACHDPDEGEETSLHFETVEDLVRLDRIIPGNAGMSRVMVRILADEMPPPQVDLPAVPPATAQLIAEFIDALPPSPAE